MNLQTEPNFLKLLFDFDNKKDSESWSVLNDSVMGGISSSKLNLSGNSTLIFSGNVSLENNGGFASLQCNVSNLDLTGYNGFVIKVKGDGKKYGFSVRQSENFTGYNYKFSFDTEKNSWQIIKIPFEKFKQTYFGKITNSQPPIKPDKIKQLSFIISDYQEGEFRIEIAQIGVF